MRIAILGWGSMLWDSGKLAITGGWHSDGPELPLEFARVAPDGRLALVLYPDGPWLPTCWVRSTATTLAEARENLRVYERTVERYVAAVPARTAPAAGVDHVAQVIDQWRKHHALDAVVWSNVPANFEDQDAAGQPLTADNVIRYLLSLPPEQRRQAEDYIRKVPAHMETPIRQSVMQRLGWNPRRTK